MWFSKEVFSFVFKVYLLETMDSTWVWKIFRMWILFESDCFGKIPSVMVIFAMFFFWRGSFCHGSLEDGSFYCGSLWNGFDGNGSFCSGSFPDMVPFGDIYFWSDFLWTSFHQNVYLQSNPSCSTFVFFSRSLWTSETWIDFLGSWIPLPQVGGCSLTS